MDIKMIKTPTYHVFDLYKYHQDAELIDSYGDEITHVTYTVSKKDGKVTVSLCNYDLTETREITLSRKEGEFVVLEAEYLTADVMDAHNTFEEPEAVSIQPFTRYKTDKNSLIVTLPPMSVASIIIKEN
ncbi:alpha-L-arabinofuranosidase C-terminal domain-containing protein [Niallia sp. FSL W8-1348]|uniref:alpha-L-arabinofuranosidase C-terminal domain-containing protein n=1 Tax=Niallia sp. FSL W8-1348 TaxID=2954656 RepID=UPI0030F5F3C7